MSKRMMHEMYVYECDNCDAYEESDIQGTPEGWTEVEVASALGMHFCAACTEALELEDEEE